VREALQAGKTGRSRILSFLLNPENRDFSMTAGDQRTKRYKTFYLLPENTAFF